MAILTEKQSWLHLSAQPTTNNIFKFRTKLQLRSCSDECLTSLVTLVLLEVLDEAGSQVLSLLFPLVAVLIGVARIENAPSHAVELCGNLEVEIRNLLGRSVQDAG